LLTLVVGLSLAELGTSLLDCSPLGCGSSRHVKVAGGRGKGQAVDKLLLKVGEALVAQEVLFRRKGTEVSALALAAAKVGVVSGEVDQAGEVVLAVKLKQGLESRQSGEVEGLSRLEAVNLGSLTLKNDLVLLVAGAECDNGKLGGGRNGEIAGVAEVVLGFRKGRAGHW
jgi:hypothetical protein